MERKDILGQTIPRDQSIKLFNAVEEDIVAVPYGDISDPNCPIYHTTSGKLLNQMSQVGGAVRFVNGAGGGLAQYPLNAYKRARRYEAVISGFNMNDSTLLELYAATFKREYGTFHTEITFTRSDLTPGAVSDVIRLQFPGDQIINYQFKTYTGDKEYIIDELELTEGGTIYGITSSVAGYFEVVDFSLVPFPVPPDPEPEPEPEPVQITITGTASNSAVDHGVEFATDDNTSTYWEGLDGSDNVVFTLPEVTLIQSFFINVANMVDGDLLTISLWDSQLEQYVPKSALPKTTELYEATLSIPEAENFATDKIMITFSGSGNVSALNEIKIYA